MEGKTGSRSERKASGEEIVEGPLWIFQRPQELFPRRGVLYQAVDGLAGLFFFSGQSQGQCIIYLVGLRQGIERAVLVGRLMVPGPGLGFVPCFLQQYPDAEPKRGEVLFFEGFFHPDKGVPVVQAVQVEGCFPGVVEMGLRGIHYRRVEQRLATVHHVPEEDAHRIGKGFRLCPGGSIGHLFVEKTLQSLLRPVVVFDGAGVYPVLVPASLAGGQGEKGKEYMQGFHPGCFVQKYGKSG